MLQYVFRITYAYESNFPIHKALKTFSRKIIVSELVSAYIQNCVENYIILQGCVTGLL